MNELTQLLNEKKPHKSHRFKYQNEKKNDEKYDPNLVLLTFKLNLIEKFIYVYYFFFVKI